MTPPPRAQEPARPRAGSALAPPSPPSPPHPVPTATAAARASDFATVLPSATRGRRWTGPRWAEGSLSLGLLAKFTLRGRGLFQTGGWDWRGTAWAAGICCPTCCPSRGRTVACWGTEGGEVAGAGTPWRCVWASS